MIPLDDPLPTNYDSEGEYIIYLALLVAYTLVLNTADVGEGIRNV